MDIIKKLSSAGNLTDDELKILLERNEFDQELFCAANEVRKKVYGNEVFIRGLIEISNHCKNNCYYCGIRRNNNSLCRYRLSEEQILSCCEAGYSIGFKTFVLQGGEDDYFSDSLVCKIVSKIKTRFPDCAITLSLGEKSKKSYQSFFDAGAERYLLRHETANPNHYSKLHPKDMSLERRIQCLCDLKEIGYQVGSGFMVGSPYQTTKNIISDLRFLQKLSPHMIGIGPFLSHRQTPFSNFEDGSFALTLKLISILRIMFPTALIPATTALGTISENGRELGIKAGANVVMPNLSPTNTRALYSLYENKLCTDEESAQNLEDLKKQMKKLGYKIALSRGDPKNFLNKNEDI